MILSVEYDNGIDGAKCSLNNLFSVCLLKMKIIFFLLQYYLTLFLLFVVIYL